VREEHEIGIESADEARSLFEKLGYAVVRRYQKVREEWQLGGVTIALDHTPIGDFAEFEAGVDLLTPDGALRDTMRHNGRAYVEANFTWPVILDRYCGFLDRFAGGVGAAPAGNGVP